jgi:hypothetical protein
MSHPLSGFFRVYLENLCVVVRLLLIVFAISFQVCPFDVKVLTRLLASPSKVARALYNAYWSVRGPKKPKIEDGVDLDEAMIHHVLGNFVCRSNRNTESTSSLFQISPHECLEISTRLSKKA